MQVNDLLRMELMAKCLGKWPVFLVKEIPCSPSSSNFTIAAFCAFKNFGTGLEGTCNTEFIRAAQVCNLRN